MNARLNLRTVRCIQRGRYIGTSKRSRLISGSCESPGWSWAVLRYSCRVFEGGFYFLAVNSVPTQTQPPFEKPSLEAGVIVRVFLETSMQCLDTAFAQDDAWIPRQSRVAVKKYMAIVAKE